MVNGVLKTLIWNHPDSAHVTFMLQPLAWFVTYETGEGCWSQICLTAKLSTVLDSRHSTGSHQLFSWEGLTGSFAPMTDCDFVCFVTCSD